MGHAREPVGRPDICAAPPREEENACADGVSRARVPNFRDMLLPLFGLVICCILLVPFWLLFRTLQPEARTTASGFRFYVGALIWPWAVAALFELFELRNVWLPNGAMYLLFLAPLAGAVLDTWWRAATGEDKLPVRIFLIAALLCGPVFHMVYWGNIEYNPTFDEQSLAGTWRGRTGDLVLVPGGWTRTGDWSLVVGSQRYRVVTSFGQLCLAQQGDPDDAAIVYRKL